MLQALGISVDGPRTVEFNGLPDLEFWPRVTWDPLFATSWDDLEAKVAGGGGGGKVHIGADTALVVATADVQIQSLDLRRGALVIGGGGAAPGPIVVEGLVVDNAGWEWQPLSPDEGCTEEEYIRGFKVVRKEQMTLP